MPSLRSPYLSALVLSAIAACGVAVGPDGEQPQVPTVEVLAPEEAGPKSLDPALFARLAILGSSASDGFNLQLETGAPTRLADYFEAGLLVDYELVSDGATSATFMNPEGIAGAAVAAAVEADPTLVVAVDFLFWFFYGSGGPGNTVDYRRERLEAGMSLLDKFGCTILVGDLPNMSGAAGGMIPLASMPPANSFAAANARITEWADAKSNVVLVPLAEFNRSVASGEPFQVGELTWDPAVSGVLLQFDQLHPNLAGTSILALQTMLSLATSRDASLEGIMMTNPEDLADAVDDLISSR